MKTEAKELCFSCRQIPYSTSGKTVEEMLNIFNDLRENNKVEYNKIGGDYGVNMALTKVLIDGGHCTRCVGLVMQRGM